jgi:aspartyl aminopeptidase
MLRRSRLVPFFSSAVSVGLFCVGILVTGQLGWSQQPEAPAETEAPDYRPAAHSYAADYKDFLSAARTEVAFVEESIRLAESNGFRELTDQSELRPGANLDRNNRGRALFLFVVGEEPFRDGFRITAAHIDSPRLDLKARPIKTSSGFVQLQTMPHGGIKNYQWVNLPLALVSRVYKKSGDMVPISIGLRAAEPVFIIPDLAPHVDSSQRNRRSRDVVAGEEMDPIVYSWTSEAASNVAANAKAHLTDVYGIDEPDLVSSELHFVPALAPRDVGLDSELVGAYGQDDRSSAYAALRALI